MQGFDSTFCLWNVNLLRFSFVFRTRFEDSAISGGFPLFLRMCEVKEERKAEGGLTSHLVGAQLTQESGNLSITGGQFRYLKYASKFKPRFTRCLVFFPLQPFYVNVHATRTIKPWDFPIWFIFILIVIV